MLESLEFSTIHLLYLNEDVQKDIEVYRKINGMVIAWVIFDVFDKETVIQAINKM